jgi:hypothetical protein
MKSRHQSGHEAAVKAPDNRSRGFRGNDRFLDRKIHWLAMAMVEPVGNNAQRQRFGRYRRLGLLRAIRHNTGQLRRLGDLAAVVLALGLDREVHGHLSSLRISNRPVRLVSASAFGTWGVRDDKSSRSCITSRGHGIARGTLERTFDFFDIGFLTGH